MKKILGLVLGLFSVGLFATPLSAFAVSSQVIVHIDKYIDGSQATASTASSSVFTMTAVYNATNIGSGSGPYTLDTTNIPIAYQQQTIPLDSGASYSTYETTGDAVVGASCADGKPFALVGYTSGDTLAAAQSGTPTTTVPAFTNLTTDKYVIVWNTNCVHPDVTVTIDKLIDGAMATSGSAAALSFPMDASWSATNIGSGSGSFTLSPSGFNSATPYEAVTANMTYGASYSVSENTGGASVGASCAEGKPFALVGYTTGNSYATALAGTPSTTTPSLTAISSSKYILVWNKNCLPVPSITSPFNNESTTTTAFNAVDWTDVTDAAGGITYYYQAASTPDTNSSGSFINLLYASGALGESRIATAGTSAGTYYIHARAKDGNGNYSDWSSTVKVIVTEPPTFYTVTIDKFIDGAMATSANASFSMSATWNAQNIGSGSGTYSLSSSTSPAFEAKTVPMQNGASYSTSENLDGTIVAGMCDTSASYALVGFTTGNTFAEAAAATPTTTVPSFTSLSANKFVIVWNKTCPKMTMLTLKKVTVGGDGAFDFSLSGVGSTTLDTTGSADHSAQKNFTFGTDAASTTISELVPAGWDLTGVTCSSDAPVSNVTATTTGVTVLLASKEHMICTFTNVKKGKLVVQKTTFPSGEKQFFLVDITGTGTITGNGEGTVSDLVDQAFEVASGTYSVVEDLEDLAHWRLVSNTCVTIYVAPGQTATCEIVNQKAATITVTKQSLGSSGQFSFTGLGKKNAFTLDTAGHTQNTVSQSFDVFTTFVNGVDTGAHVHVQENTDPAWVANTTTCDADVISGGNAACSFTNTKLGTITGFKYEDIEGSGKNLVSVQTRKLSGFVVYADLNNNNQLDSGEPQATTDTSGAYELRYLPVGITYVIREVQQPGWMTTYPTSGKYSVTINAGTVAKNINFGNFKLWSVNGYKFNDLNANHRKDANESYLQGWTITLQGGAGGSQQIVSDANGYYSFGNLGPGKYTLSEVMQNGWIQTLHPAVITAKSGTNYVNKLFGNKIKGPKETNPNMYNSFTN